jgi:opacity protein-like surface antigen
MTTFRQFSAVVAAVAVSLALLAPLPARADHESTTQPPQQRPQEPTRLPGAKEAWDDGFYYALDFTLGDSANPNTDAGFSVDLDWSSSAGFGVGYRLGPLRLEGQLLTQFYRVGSLDLTGGSPFPLADYSGGIRTLNGMANLYIDLPAAGKMRPYIGAGYGLARVSADYNESVCYIFCFSTQNEIVDDWDKVNAWQGMLGVSFASASPNMEWYIGYRYYETEDLDFRTLSGVPFRQEGLQDHAFMFGFRFLTN